MKRYSGPVGRRAETSKSQHRMPHNQWRRPSRVAARIGCWMLGVGCWVFFAPVGHARDGSVGPAAVARRHLTQELDFAERATCAFGDGAKRIFRDMHGE